MDDLQERVLAAKEDDAYFTLFVKDHKAWVLSCAAKAAGRYVTDSDDELNSADCHIKTGSTYNPAARPKHGSLRYAPH